MKNKFKNYKDHSVKLAALFTAVAGIINIWSSITPALPERLQALAQFIPLEANDSGRLFTTLAGFALLFLANGLWRRKRAAWVLTIVVLIASAVAHLVKGLDFEEASVALLDSFFLGSLYSHFQAKSDIPSIRQGLRTLFWSLLFILVYGVGGFFWLDKQYSVNFSFLPALKQTIDMFVRFDNPGLIPITRFGRYFADSIYIISASVLGYAFFMFMRPVILRQLTTETERERARGIISTYGASSLSHLVLMPDKNYFFSLSGSVIAYVLKGKTALVLGDPIGPSYDVSPALEQFISWCQKNDWAYGFYQTQPSYLTEYKKAKLKVLCIGQEGIVDLKKFTISGNQNRSLRSAYNRIQKLNYRQAVLTPPIAEDVIQELWDISDAWLENLGHQEKRFSFGWFTAEYLRANPVIVVYNPENKIVAFANIISEYRLNEITIDLMRYLPNLENGLMDYLFISLFSWAQEQGYESFNFGLSALYDIQQIPNDNPAVEKILTYIYNHGSRFYNFKGLNFFKEKYNPRWSPRYLVYPQVGALPNIFLALIKATSDK